MCMCRLMCHVLCVCSDIYIGCMCSICVLCIRIVRFKWYAPGLYVMLYVRGVHVC